MKIYVGRWNLLPEEWEGINGLYEKSEEEIAAETKRQQDYLLLYTGQKDEFVGHFTPKEFEETFNQGLTRFLSPDKYWIKIF